MVDKIINRYSISVFDFDKAIEFAMCGKGYSPDNIVYEALIFSAIICYARPFSRNERDKASPASAQITISDIVKLSAEEVGLHELLIELRNKTLAHSEFQLNPTSVNLETGVFRSRPFSLLSHPIDIDAFIGLTTKLVEACHEKRADYVRLTGSKALKRP